MDRCSPLEAVRGGRPKALPRGGRASATPPPPPAFDAAAAAAGFAAAGGCDSATVLLAAEALLSLAPPPPCVGLAEGCGLSASRTPPFPCAGAHARGVGRDRSRAAFGGCSGGIMKWAREERFRGGGHRGEGAPRARAPPRHSLWSGSG